MLPETPMPERAARCDGMAPQAIQICYLSLQHSHANLLAQHDGSGDISFLLMMCQGPEMRKKSKTHTVTELVPEPQIFQ